MEYENVNVIVPEPAAYVLHKFVIQERRLNKEKKKGIYYLQKKSGNFYYKIKLSKKR